MHASFDFLLVCGWLWLTCINCQGSYSMSGMQVLESSKLLMANSRIFYLISSEPCLFSPWFLEFLLVSYASQSWSYTISPYDLSFKKGIVRGSSFACMHWIKRSNMSYQFFTSMSLFEASLAFSIHDSFQGSNISQLPSFDFRCFPVPKKRTYIGLGHWYFKRVGYFLLFRFQSAIK